MGREETPNTMARRMMLAAGKSKPYLTNATGCCHLGTWVEAWYPEKGKPLWPAWKTCVPVVLTMRLTRLCFFKSQDYCQTGIFKPNKGAGIGQSTVWYIFPSSGGKFLFYWYLPLRIENSRQVCAGLQDKCSLGTSCCNKKKKKRMRAKRVVQHWHRAVLMAPGPWWNYGLPLSSVAGPCTELVFNKRSGSAFLSFLGPVYMPLLHPCLGGHWSHVYIKTLYIK